MSENIKKFEILKQFTIKNPTEVEHYLSKYPVLASVLQEAHEQIHILFPDSEIELNVVRDPEIPDDVTLFAYVWTNLDMDTVWELERQLENRWYLDLPYTVRNIFNFSVR